MLSSPLNGLPRADMRPATTQRVAGDLCHGRMMENGDIYILQRPRCEIGYDIVVENR